MIINKNKIKKQQLISLKKHYFFFFFIEKHCFLIKIKKKPFLFIINRSGGK